jgi:hypothetical protein
MIKTKVAILTAMILVVGIVSVVGINTTFADSKKAIVNNCVVDKDTGKCDIKQFYKTKNGDIEVTNNVDVSAIMGGGSGNVSTVDQEARDGVTALQNQDTIQDNNIGSVQAQTEELRVLINELNSTLQNAVIDISDSGAVDNQTGNGSSGGTNDTGGVVTNDTGGVVTNETTGGNGNVTNNTEGTVNGTLPVSFNIQEAFNNFIGVS